VTAKKRKICADQLFLGAFAAGSPESEPLSAAVHAVRGEVEPTVDAARAPPVEDCRVAPDWRLLQDPRPRPTHSGRWQLVHVRCFLFRFGTGTYASTEVA